MDESAVVAFIEKNLESMMREFGVPHWRVVCKTSVNSPDVRGVVSISAPYDRATIELDPAYIGDETTLRTTIEHELIHCVLGPFDLADNAACEWIPEGPARESFRRVWTYAMEQAIRNVERMAWGLRHAGDKTGDVKTTTDGIEAEANGRVRRGIEVLQGVDARDDRILIRPLTPGGVWPGDVLEFLPTGEHVTVKRVWSDRGDQVMADVIRGADGTFAGCVDFNEDAPWHARIVRTQHGPT